ncbi:MAG: LysR family transcriptional regulator [Gammaproteobacteria bacterium]|nr:LysR family transcriptional regulator [Gammaproteobacteria bacterium]
MSATRRIHRGVIRDLQPKLISHFLAVADNLSISQAADVLSLTQPALSKSIKQLEDRLGVPLFERWPTGVKLTQYGEVLARRARLIDRELSYAITELQTLKGGASGVLRIGAGLIWSQRYLPPIIARFQKLHAGVGVELRSGVIDTLVPALIAGELDLVCTALDFPDSNDYVKEPLVEIRHGIYSAAAHPLAGLARVTPEQLAQYGWVTLKNDYVGRNRLGSLFAASGLEPPNVRVELAVDMAVLSLIAASDYLCSLPKALADTARTLGVVELATGGANLWTSTGGVAYRRTGFPAPAVKTFLAMLRESFHVRS